MGIRVGDGPVRNDGRDRRTGLRRANPEGRARASSSDRKSFVQRQKRILRIGERQDDGLRCEEWHVEAVRNASGHYYSEVAEGSWPRDGAQLRREPDRLGRWRGLLRI